MTTKTRTAGISFVGAVGLSLALTGPAPAGVIVAVAQTRYVEGNAFVTDADGDETDGERFDAEDFDAFRAAASGDVDRSGGYASGGGNHDSDFDGSSITARGAAFANAGAWEEDASGDASGRTQFDLTFTLSATVDFTMNVALAAYDDGSLSVSFTGPDGPVVDVEVPFNDELMTTERGTLGPGEYRLVLEARGSAYGDAFGKGYAFAEYDVDLALAGGRPGDIDGDGDVDLTDLLALLSAWGVCEGETCPADINEDGVVDFDDLLLLLSNWGPA